MVDMRLEYGRQTFLKLRVSMGFPRKHANVECRRIGRAAALLSYDKEDYGSDK